MHGAAVAVEAGHAGGDRAAAVRRLLRRGDALRRAQARLGAELPRSCVEQLDPERWRGLFTAMADEGRRTLVSEGARPEDVEVRYSADLRYLRQIHELNMPKDESLAHCPEMDTLHARFDALHERLFGYRLPE